MTIIFLWEVSCVYIHLEKEMYALAILQRLDVSST